MTPDQIQNALTQLQSQVTQLQTTMSYHKHTGSDFTKEISSGSGTGDMEESTYDPAGIAQQLVGVTAVQTLTNKTLTTPAISSISNSGTITLPTTTTTLVGQNTTDTLTNKRIAKRVLSLSSGSATPSIDTDNYDIVHITNQNAGITSFSTNLTGTPVDGDTLRVSITDSGTSESISWGSKFESSLATLPTATVVSTRLDIGFFWNTEDSTWRCMAVS